MTHTTAVMIPIVISSDEDETDCKCRVTKDIKEESDFDEDDTDSKCRVAKDLKDESDFDDDKDMYIKSESDDDEEDIYIKSESDEDDEEDQNMNEPEQDESKRDLKDIADTSRPFNRHLSKQRQAPKSFLSTKANIIPWDSSAKRVLSLLRERQTPWAEIAAMLERTESSCKSTWNRMQLSANRITLTDDVLQVFDEVYCSYRVTIHKMLREEVNRRLKASGMLKHGQKITTQQIRQAFARHCRE